MPYQLRARKSQWIKAQIGLKYLQEGLAPFCDDIVNQQHKDILDNIKKTKYLTTAVCDQCDLTTLRPDHARNGKKICPLGQLYCGCCRRACTFCPNEVCGAIYDEIAKYHTSYPCWKNTKAQQWTSYPWSIAKCFFESQGYLPCTSASSTGISELLELILSNKYFHEYITRMDLLFKVTLHKMSIYNSSDMHLDKLEVDMYIDDMIAVLQDDKKLKSREDAQKAVKNLQALKKIKDFAEDDCNKRSIAQHQVSEQKMYILEKIGTLGELDEDKYRDDVTDIWQHAEKPQNRNRKRKCSIIQDQVSEQKMYILEKIGTLGELDEDKYLDVVTDIWQHAEKPQDRNRKQKRSIIQDQVKTKKSGPFQKEPDVFRVVLKITSIQFTEKIRAAGRDIGRLDITQQLKTALQDLFRSLPGVIGIKIVDLQPGSLIVKFEIISDGQQTDDEITQTLQKMLNKGSFSNYSVSPENYDCRKITGTKKRFDGRLIKLEEKDIKILKKHYTKLIGRGSLGKVFSTSDDTVPADFGIRIALKKIDIQPNSREESVRRELMASRILHPFILPLLAVADCPFGLQEVWFVSPLCENGDLYTAIKQGAIEMDQRTRLKILLQVALAIRYLHTAVPNVRPAILHKDIASRNVVLDVMYNARLIDFGLAREIDDHTATATGRMYFCHTDVGAGETATESCDYYNFGVIIREMLTSPIPEGDENNGRKFLKEMTSEEVLENLSEDIWKYTDGARVLANTSEVCLRSLDLSGFNTKVVKEIQEIWRYLNYGRLLDVPEGHAKCHICMINPKAPETSMRQDHASYCRQKIEACIACEKNSFLNPIRCYCDKDLKSTIGSRCGALLVAGNDENKKMAEALKKDIYEMKKVTTSRAPLIMGIREDMVRMIVPNKPGSLEASEQLVPELKKHIEFFSKESEIDTLLIYFSCHGAKQSQRNIFELGSPSDSITVDDFNKDLECLENIDQLMVFLDRCYPPMVTAKGRKCIQINACNENQKAQMTDEGSKFTKYFIQGLKAKSDKQICPSDCKPCFTYWSNKSDFINVPYLFDYVNSHIRNNDSEPTGYGPYGKSIAYYTHEKVEIDFSWNKAHRAIPLEYFQTIEQLEEKLCKEFARNKNTTKVKIQKDTFRNKDRFQDCDTLEKVMSAWVHRQPLTVKFDSEI